MKIAALITFAVLILSIEAIFQGQNWMTAPYMARLQLTVGVQGGGAIISHRHVLTSGFLLQNVLPTPTVYIGGVTRQTQRPVTVQTRIIHPAFVSSPRANDIGILVLNADLVFDRFVQPIALPGFTGKYPLENEQGTALGFGGFPNQENRENLEAAFLRILPHSRCTANPPISVEQAFCAEDARLRSDICNGDIGGPLVVLTRGQEVLVGIGSSAGCQGAALSFFSRVSTYRTWINSVTQV